MHDDVADRLRQLNETLDPARFSAGQLAERLWAQNFAGSLGFKALAKDELERSGGLLDVVALLSYRELTKIVGLHNETAFLTSKVAEGFVTEALVVFAQYFQRIGLNYYTG